jgi:hypothetical protein
MSALFLAWLSAPAGADKISTFTLSPGDTYDFTSKRPTSGSGAGVSLIGNPTQCQTPPFSETCDVFFLNANRDESPGAVNFLIARLSWDGRAQVPDLALVVAGLGIGSVVDYEVYVWEKDATGAWARRTDITGGQANPKLVGWEATKPEYAVTVQNLQGASLGYHFSMEMSNEKFKAPFEVLDPSNNSSFTPPVDRSGSEPPPAGTPASSVDQPATAVAAPPAAMVAAPAAAIAPDADFSGFRGAVDNSLTGDLAAFRTNAPSSAAAGAKAPAWGLVIFWLLIVPFLIALVVAFVIRRRRPLALSA